MVSRLYKKNVIIGVKSRPNDEDIRKVKAMEVQRCVQILNKG